MYSLQFLSMRKGNDPEMIPKKCDFKRCCQIIHPEQAIKNGHLECVRYIHNLDEDIEVYDCEFCVRACEYGQLHCLKYLHEHGYSWDGLTCAIAAEFGDLEYL